ncbi:MAG: hypothetical protein H6823_15430 [Planctomycetaceae bacterium]|nr:hypothetical protein [Planctomycetaceae bacterium]
MSAEASKAGRPKSQKPPSLPRQVWNLAQSLASFVADGCKTVTPQQYQARLEVCDTCDQRKGNRCMKCGCQLSLKARGRAFRCPLAKWPDITKEDNGC